MGLRCTLRDIDGYGVAAVCLGIVSIDQAAGWRVRPPPPTSDHAGCCGHIERNLDGGSLDRPRRLDFRPKSRIPLRLNVDTIGSIHLVRLFTLTSRKPAGRIGILLGVTHGRGDGFADDRPPPAPFQTSSRTGRHFGILSKVAFPATMLGAFAVNTTLVSMGWSILGASYVAVVLAAAAGTCFEFVIPYDKSWQPRWTDVKNDLLFMVAIQMVLPQVLGLVVALTALGYFESLDWSLAQVWPSQLPLILQVALMLLTAELFRYPLHVAAHNTKTLWRLHAVHHSPKKLYWLNVGRFHPVEKALQYSLDTLPFMLVGVGGDVVALYFLFYAINGFYQHSNVDVCYGPLNYLVSGPELHRWHHSKLVDESNRNYGNNLIVWDLLFGTWFLPKRVRVSELGLFNRDYPLDFVGQMTAPLTPGLDKQSPPHDR